jgi:hypothetical protein
LGEKRDPSEIYANSNLRNVTHITQKPSYVYTFFTSTLKEITALVSRGSTYRDYLQFGVFSLSGKNSLRLKCNAQCHYYT